MKLNKSWIVAIILAIIALTAMIYYGTMNKAPECNADSDCVPATCCHPDSCVSSANAPKCEGIMCTQECQEGTMDCGQGSCSCNAGKCGVK